MNDHEPRIREVASGDAGSPAFLFGLLLAATFLLPLIVVPGLRDPYTFPKWAVGFLFALSLFHFLPRPLFSSQRTVRRVLIPFLFLTAVHIAAIPGSVNPWRGAEVVLGLAGGLMWFAGGCVLLKAQRQRIAWARILSVSALVASAYGIGQTMGLDLRGALYVIPSSFLGHRNYAAQFLIIAIPFPSIFLLPGERA